jgi:hypothetical protein
MAYTIQHTAIGRFPHWYHVESWDEGHRNHAIKRGQQIAMDKGGYVCVQDHAGKVVFGTDPAQLDRAISAGTNRDFRKETARRLGCCVS